MISDALRLLRADLLKLHRRRGLLVLSFGIGFGLVVIMLAYLQIRHSSNPALYPPPGADFDHATDLVGYVSLVTGALIGSTAGAGDAEAGVLRDLVGTGRSRLALFASRATAGCLLTLLVTATGLVLADASAALLSGHLAVPSLSHVLQRDAAVLAFAAAGALLAAGASELTSSRGPVIATLIVVGLVVSQFLLRASSLGDVRAALPLEAFLRLVGDGTWGVRESLAAAGGVLAGWAALALGAGGWRSRRVEI